MRTTAALLTVRTLADGKRAPARGRLPDALGDERGELATGGVEVAAELLEEPARRQRPRRADVADGRGEAAPGPVACSFDESGPHRVVRDVAGKLEQVGGRLDRDPGEAPLEAVAGIGGIAIEPPR